jgi:GLPGLI family protein
MKKFIISFCLFTAISFSQNNATFVYGITPISDPNSELEKMMESMDADYLTKTSTVEFLLVTDKKSISCFTMDENSVGMNKSSIKMGIIMAGYNGKVKQSNDSIYRESFQEMSNKTYTVVDAIQNDWKITAETKEIMGNVCYKAVCERVVINSVGTFRSDVIAWFCPKYPFPFGPIGYGKLPGLIFELQNKNAVFGLKKISLNTNDSICELNKKNSSISSKALDELIASQHGETIKYLKSQEK